MSRSAFFQRDVCIATMHGKEKAIGPHLEEAFSVNIIVPDTINTDRLGTFSGEAPRTLSPLEAARQKCEEAMDLTGCDIAIASEGSFGPHPTMFFAKANEELLLLMDRKHGWEIVARHLSTETNMEGTQVSNEDALRAFANNVGFPSHGIIVRPSEKDTTQVTKGITDWDTLFAVFNKYMRDLDVVFVETDMRALFNPTRMKNIGLTAAKLVEQMQCLCPKCAQPGFGVKGSRTGLPCSWCGAPTQSTLVYLHTCDGCHCVREEQFPHGKTQEDPMYCDVCNP